MSQVAYLGHVLSGAGMIPDPQKIKVVQDWPVPQNTTAVRQFLGLASYYRWYIHHFSETAALLHALTQKGVPFNWSAECAEAFTAVKDHLTQAPVLAYPRFDHNAGTFYLQTDAGAACPTAVAICTKDGGHVVSVGIGHTRI